MEEPKYVTYNSDLNIPASNVVKQDLPNSTAILVLGILSIVFAGLIGIILAIIALSMAGNARSLYNSQPDTYSSASFSRVNAGRICAIVGLCLVGILILVILAVLAVAG